MSSRNSKPGSGSTDGPDAARAQMLARIDAALTGGPPGAGSARVPAAPIPRDYRRAGAHPAGAPELLALFTDRLRDYRAAVHPATPRSLASVLADVLAGAGRVIVAPQLPSAWIPAGAYVDDGSPGPTALDDFDTVLTGCAAAAADTGTIVLDAAGDQGRRAITLVPDRHVCVVRAEQVVHTIPELLALLDPVRPLTFISGPSATSDIELQRVEGVHGPRTLVVVLVAAVG